MKNQQDSIGINIAFIKLSSYELIFYKKKCLFCFSYISRLILSLKLKTV